MTNILNINKVKPIVELSNNQLIAKAKSVGALAPINGVSEKYDFVPTINAVNFLRDEGWIPTTVSETRSRAKNQIGFQRHLIRFSKNDLVSNDRRMELCLYNSHDAGSSFKLCGGIYRLVCLNGMVIGENMMEYAHRHVGFQVEDFIESARFIGAGLEKIADKTEKWTELQLEKEEREDFAWAAHNYMYSGETGPVEPIQFLEARRQQDTGTDLWSTFNVIQENIIKGQLNGKRSDGKNFRTRPVINLVRDKEINQSLWVMAEAVEQYKAA